MSANEYDFYLREGSVRGGEWVGFALAWKGLAGLPGLPSRPYTRRIPWILDPAHPDDPTYGSWGVPQWHMSVALVDGVVGLGRQPPVDGRGAADMRADMLAYQAAGSLTLQDIDGSVYAVKMILYTEEAIEAYDASHPAGGMLATVEFALAGP
jgi:hypothetical protein